MKAFITIFIFTTTLSRPTTSVPPQNSTFDYVGCMPEIVVTAPQYEYEDEAWSGLMPEVVVTAPRYDGKDMYSAGIIATGEQNRSDVDNAAFQTSMNNRDNNQSLNKDINFIIFAQVRLPIYVIVLEALSFIIALFLLFHFLRKYRRLLEEVSNVTIN